MTCHRIGRLAGLPAKQSRVQRFVETAPQLSSTATKSPAESADKVGALQIAVVTAFFAALRPWRTLREI